ncbi:4'-phosphopantetheinyl transferase family protein [Vallitalea sp.]|uniref:4'-phosphopantetheinyl transferase family protein n=1 Tax=Vallitalea sp. TaxID=1882829 RepID=UPI0025CCBE03|nr:4'-phosphopantetheinyl transferase superfamily protein [Vallitalea sp.]MCT4687032.1 4'-phosphopantetheinyl transferase superfamily protein [Vallitalea sp.]
MKYIDIETELVDNNETVPVMISLCSLRESQMITKEFMDNYLSLQEKKYYDELKYEARKVSYLLGRISSKRALASFLDNDKQEISIDKGIFYYPIIKNNNKNLTVTITHTKYIGAAAAVKEHYPIGIDIEAIDINHVKSIKSQMTEQEINLVKNCQWEEHEGVIAIWTIKEALSKSLKIGFLTPLKIYEVNSLDCDNNCIISRYKNFPMFKAKTFKLNGSIFTICYPNKCDLMLEYSTMENTFNKINIL